MNAITAPVVTRRSVSVLADAFAFFNAMRIVAYLPTLFAIHGEGHTDQHSLLTWLCFLGANATMALWLYEQNGHRPNRAIAVSAGNAVMCAAIAVSIIWLRWGHLAAGLGFRV